MPARIQGLVFGLGNPQADIETISSSFVRMTKIDSNVPFLRANTENDAPWIGKGNEFISVGGVYKTNKEPNPLRMEKYGSVEATMLAWAYALGDVTGAGTYVIKPIDNNSGLEMPYFTVVSQIGEGGGSALDEAQIGCSMESVETACMYGPNLATIRTTMEIVGSGQSAIPSGVVLPTTLPENYALSSSMAIAINGIDYVSTKTALRATMGWKNNFIMPMRYFPGSGLDADGFAVGGRTFIGVRQPTLSFTAFLTKDSDEYAKLVAQTSGTAVITITFDATHYVTWTYSNVSFESRDVTQEEGIVAVMVNVAPRFDPTNGVLVVSGKCDITTLAA